MKQYGNVLRLAALLIVLSLTGPSLVTLACAFACPPATTVATAAAGGEGCHDHGATTADAPALVAGHDCHDVRDTPVLGTPSSSQLVPTSALVRVMRSLRPQSEAEAANIAPVVRSEPPLLLPADIPLRI